jgi:hypothetical protein
MRKLDTRWIVVPVVAILALTVGGVSPWVVALVCASTFRIYVRF